MSTTQYLRYPNAAGTGTVTSVALSLPASLFTVSGSPVTTGGTLTGTLISQTANEVFAAPNGSAGVPSFRLLVAADIPSLAYVTSVTASAPITSSGGTTPNIAVNSGNLTDVGTDGIVVTGGTGAVLGSGTSLAQHVADTTHNGYLSSTDWNTFNGKQPAGSYITALTGDVTASGPGSAAATLATVNGSPGTFTYATLTVNGKGLVTSASSGTAPVTSVTASSPLSSSGGTTPNITITSPLPVTNGGTGAASLTLNNVILGNGTSPVQFVAPGTSGNVLTSDGTTWTSATPATVTFKAPTIQSFTSGSGTYTTPTSPSPLYIRVKLVGGGGGGAGSGISGGTGGTGVTTTFGTSLLSGTGGVGAAWAAALGGVGGTGSLGSGPTGLTI